MIIAVNSNLSNWEEEAQLVEHRTGIAEVTGSNPVEALIFFRLLLPNCLNWKIYCDDHTTLSSLICELYINLPQSISLMPFLAFAINKVNTLSNEPDHITGDSNKKS